MSRLDNEIAQRHQFLASIVAFPDDDAIREIYADWLEEHDGPKRSELIRSQIALNRHRRGIKIVDDEAALAKRVMDLCSFATSNWKNLEAHPLGIQIWNDPDDIESMFVVQWERGFIERVYCRLEHWLTHGAVLVRLLPLGANGVRILDIKPREAGERLDADHRLWVLDYDDERRLLTSFGLGHLNLKIEWPDLVAVGAWIGRMAIRWAWRQRPDERESWALSMDKTIGELRDAALQHKSC